MSLPLPETRSLAWILLRVKGVVIKLINWALVADASRVLDKS
ncbi:hypothetical protein [Coleofasciculus sp. FACHB-1120]|nr:hypothetical protein [Coleofasciculus sp. FACHB-1120]